MSKKQKKVLVIAAHPDDEILGCGATIAHHTERGDTVTVLILSEGVCARKDNTKVQQKIETLKQEAKKANKILGVKDLIILQFPDQKFDTVPILEITQVIEDSIKKIRPQIIYSHHWGDINNDHRITAHAVQTACRPLSGTSFESLYAFEVPSSTEWNFAHENQFVPTVFFDSSDTIKKKIEAMKAYDSEIKDFPHPRSSEYLHSLSKIRGAQVGFNAAEAFELIYKRISNT